MAADFHLAAVFLMAAALPMAADFLMAAAFGPWIQAGQ